MYNWLRMINTKYPRVFHSARNGTLTAQVMVGSRNGFESDFTIELK